MMQPLIDWLRDGKAWFIGQPRYDQELRRYAEFGRVSAGLIHELSTPLSAAALTLDEIKLEYPSSLVQRARKDIKQLEKYILAARKQLKGETCNTTFSLTIAIHQVVMLLSGRAKISNVKLVVNSIGSVRLHGDPVKFHQVLCNLILNAIEAYDGTAIEHRVVTILVRQTSKAASITVSDNAKAISRKDRQRIFKPFYSTKQGLDRGLGIGLLTVKQYVEHDFKGKIKVRSNHATGTSFTVVVPMQLKFKPLLRDM